MKLLLLYLLTMCEQFFIINYEKNVSNHLKRKITIIHYHYLTLLILSVCVHVLSIIHTNMSGLCV